MTLEAKKRAALKLDQLVAGNDDQLVLSTGTSSGPFDEEHDGNVLFWRGDSDARSPTDVFRDGFVARYVLNRVADAGKIVWRAEQDDVLHESAVCLARDLRGAAFFPFTDAADAAVTDEIYIYAIAPARTANTYRAQQIAEAVETGQMDGSKPPKRGFWRSNRDRWRYDPEEESDAASSCVWQFQEHATLKVKPSEIVACWAVARTMMVDPGIDDRQKAGIRFKVNSIVRQNKSHELLADAKKIVEQYQAVYPKKGGSWLSFRGIVECSKRVEDLRDARLLARQVQAIVVNESGTSDRGEY